MTANALPIPIVIIKDGKPVTTSLIVAESFGKRHDHVLRDIDAIVSSDAYQERILNVGSCVTTERRAPNFGLTSHSVYMPNAAQREDRMYEMDRQGFEILAMGFTGEEALRWKFKYSDAFAAMEQALLDQRILDAMPRRITTTQLHKLPRDAALSLDTRQNFQTLCRELNIVSPEAYPSTSLQEWMAKPDWIDSIEVIPLVAAVLEDILNWRYPYPYAYGRFDYVGSGLLYLNLVHVFDHLRKATHFKDFFACMRPAARLRIEQALTQGALSKVKKGPVVEGAKLNYRLDVDDFLEKQQAFLERRP